MISTTSTTTTPKLSASDGHRAAHEELHRITAEQHLVSLALQLQAAQEAVRAELSELRAELGRVAAGLTGTREELQEYARRIRPPVLDEGGLPSALKMLLRTSVPDQVNGELADLLQLRLTDPTLPSAAHGSATVELAIMRLTKAQERGDLPAAAEEAKRLLAPVGVAAGAELTVGDDLRALAIVSLGAAELWASRAGEAARHLEQGTALARRIGRPWLEVKGLAHLAMTARSGAFAVAMERGTQAIELARRHGWATDPDAGIAYLALAIIEGWQGRLEEADPLLNHAGQALGTEGRPAARLVLHTVRGAHELARDRAQDALTALLDADKLANTLVTPHPLVTQLRAFLVQTLVRAGDNDRAEAALAQTDRPERETGHMRIALATVRLAQRDPQTATAALGPVLDGSAPISEPAWRIEALLLDAIARETLGDPRAAATALELGLDLAEPDAVVFPFLLHPARELLERHALHSTAHAGLISRILSLLPSPQEHVEADSSLVDRESPGKTVRGGEAALPAPLTDTETRVLRYLATTHLAGPEIARELFVSVNTVRTHMRHIYEKLGAHRRSEAVDRARALGLLAYSPHTPMRSPDHVAIRR